MTQEQKAQAYDEAVERANELIYVSDKDSLQRKTVEHIFPELKEESEDKRMLKQLRDFFKNHIDSVYEEIDDNNDVLAWLEKQGEKKSIDGLTPQEAMDIAVAKFFEQGEHEPAYVEEPNFFDDFRKSDSEVEPKFKVGDWVIDKSFGSIKQIKHFDNDEKVWFTDGTGTFIEFLEGYRLWTIEDAKAGDVLADGNLPFIFKKIDSNKYCYAYCGISVDDGFKIESEGKSSEWTWMQDIKPATKEQRDMLFRKMKEAGYEWDAEKKELKKIIDEKQIKKNLQDNSFRRMFEQKPAWSEEDSPYYDDICEILINLLHSETANVNKAAVQKDLDWLKSLKGKFQPKQKWSKEDESHLNNL